MAALVALPGVGALLVQGLEQHHQQRIFQFPEDECRRDNRAASHQFTPDEAQVAPEARPAGGRQGQAAFPPAEGRRFFTPMELAGISAYPKVFLYLPPVFPMWYIVGR